MRLPKGAEAIHAARMKGQRPAEMVLVSLIGPLGERNPTVFVPAGSDVNDFEWRWAFGLDTTVVCDTRSLPTARKLLRRLLDLKVNGVGRAFVWQADAQQGWDCFATDEGIASFPLRTHDFAGLGCC